MVVPTIFGWTARFVTTCERGTGWCRRDYPKGVMASPPPPSRIREREPRELRVLVN
jgi:hypothetical protein